MANKKIITRLKNINYIKEQDEEFASYTILDKNNNYLASVLLYESVLFYNKYGYHQE